MGDIAESEILNKDEKSHEPRKELNTKWQWVAACAASTGILGSGTVLGWTSPYNPELKDSGDIGELSNHQLSWIASISLVAALMSCFIIGYTVERIGRRMTSMVVVVPFVIGFVIIAGSQNVEMLYAGRFITGFCAGAYTVITPVYINEICENKLRNILATFMMVIYVTGVEVVYIIGALVGWRIGSILCCCFPISHFVIMLFLPETPRYLLTKGQRAKAATSLKWVRGADSTQDVEHELKEIQAGIDELKESAENGSGGRIFVGSNMKPCLMSVISMSFQQLAGVNAVLFYTVDIFRSAGSDVDPNVASIIVGATQVIAYSFNGIIINKFRRKTLFVVSEVGVCISLVVLGVYYYLKENKPVVAENIGWLPLLCLVMYMIIYCVGIGPLVWTLLSDLSPPHIKGIASAMTTSANWSMGFLVTVTFQSMIDGIHQYGAFWVFAGISAVGAAFAAFILPETKGKTVDEVMRLFADKV